jgi:carbon storage regulator CsrA
MLVLSRRPNEKIVFPDFHAAVEVLSVKPGKVRIGIKAPPHVRVLREEISMRDGLEESVASPPQGSVTIPCPSPLTQADLRELRHAVRNRLNTAAVALALLRRQLHAGLTRVAMEETLDRMECEFDTLQQKLDEVKEQPAPDRATRRPKVLLVEDDRNECELTAGFLRLSGMEVHTAADGADALEYLCAHSERDRPDVMLLDMGLPRCDGMTIVRSVRREPAYSGFKIFAVTGHHPEEYELDSTTSRIDRWFQKPVNPEALLRDLTQELQRA